ncbi:hypothetical protein [Sphingobium sp.]|uniref:hypothetical protein n=1 Tax=Sphingobium sp. TaxID=1912891 RepID=UPI002626A991|nr:hypothetical protein [Sphingobium sp.]
MNWGRILGGAGVLALALALAWLYGNARYDAGKSAGTLAEAGKWQKRVDEQSAQIADLRVANERKVAQATTRYVETREQLQPIIVQSKERVREYAATPSGAVQCLASDRVHGIDANAAALGLQPAPAADGGDATLHPDADPP